MATEIHPRSKVIRDPVHGIIEFNRGDEFLLELIDCLEFQRLRRVKQLGVSCITYPGAEHTRFAHSLGVLNFSTRILDRLRQRYVTEVDLLTRINQDAPVIRAAALLHDTGHGPFSHMIERAFSANSKHEHRTADVITNPESQVCRVLKAHHIDPDAVRSVIDGTFPVRFLRDIVSSQLDADRMDYLLRDARMTGVEYGQYDPDWIIHAMCVGRDPAARDEGIDHLRLCLDRARGLHAAEQFVVARMHMSHQVYFHRVTRGWEAHLLCLFRVANDLAKQAALPSQTPSVVARFFAADGLITHKDFLAFDEPAMLCAFQEWSAFPAETDDQRTLASLARAYLTRTKEFVSGDDLIAEPLQASFREEKELLRRGAIEGRDFYHDDAKFRGYKDFGRSVMRPETDSEGSEAIFLASGRPSEAALPIEQDPRAVITPALIQSGARHDALNRVFYRSHFRAGGGV